MAEAANPQATVLGRSYPTSNQLEQVETCSNSFRQPSAPRSHFRKKKGQHIGLNRVCWFSIECYLNASFIFLQKRTTHCAKAFQFIKIFFFKKSHFLSKSVCSVNFYAKNPIFNDSLKELDVPGFRGKVKMESVFTLHFHVYYSSFCCFSITYLFQYLSTNKLTRKNKLFKNNFIYTFVSLTVWPLSSFTRSPNSNNSLKEQISSFKQYSKVVNWKSLHSKNYRVWNFKNKEKKLGYACRGSLSALFIF